MRKRILIVDDEGHIRQMVRLTLETAGYEVGEAADGIQGLVAFADGSTWDAVLLDQRMPGLDGLETTRSLRRIPELAALPIVMVTAAAFPQDQANALAAGCDAVLLKPVSLGPLTGAIVPGGNGTFTSASGSTQCWRMTASAWGAFSCGLSAGEKLATTLAPTARNWPPWSTWVRLFR